MQALRSLVAIWAFLGLSMAAPAQASILYDAVDLGGGSWRYDYQLVNDNVPYTFDEFTLFFDAELYANLRDASGPASWDLLTVQTHPALPDAGFLDGLALTLLSQIVASCKNLSHSVANTRRERFVVEYRCTE